MLSECLAGQVLSATLDCPYPGQPIEINDLIDTETNWHHIHNASGFIRPTTRTRLFGCVDAHSELQKQQLHVSVANTDASQNQPYVQ